MKKVSTIILSSSLFLGIIFISFHSGFCFEKKEPSTNFEQREGFSYPEIVPISSLPVHSAEEQAIQERRTQCDTLFQQLSQIGFMVPVAEQAALKQRITAQTQSITLNVYHKNSLSEPVQRIVYTFDRELGGRRFEPTIALYEKSASTAPALNVQGVEDGTIQVGVNLNGTYYTAQKLCFDTDKGKFEMVSGERTFFEKFFGAIGSIFSFIGSLFTTSVEYEVTGQVDVPNAYGSLDRQNVLPAPGDPAKVQAPSSQKDTVPKGVSSATPIIEDRFNASTIETMNKTIDTRQLMNKEYLKRIVAQMNEEIKSNSASTKTVLQWLVAHQAETWVGRVLIPSLDSQAREAFKKYATPILDPAQLTSDSSSSAEPSVPGPESDSSSSTEPSVTGSGSDSPITTVALSSTSSGSTQRDIALIEIKTRGGRGPLNDVDLQNLYSVRNQEDIQKFIANLGEEGVKSFVQYVIRESGQVIAGLKTDLPKGDGKTHGDVQILGKIVSLISDETIRDHTHKVVAGFLNARTFYQYCQVLAGKENPVSESVQGLLKIRIKEDLAYCEQYIYPGLQTEFLRTSAEYLRSTYATYGQSYSEYLKNQNANTLVDCMEMLEDLYAADIKLTNRESYVAQKQQEISSKYGDVPIVKDYLLEAIQGAGETIVAAR